MNELIQWGKDNWPTYDNGQPVVEERLVEEVVRATGIKSCCSTLKYYGIPFVLRGQDDFFGGELCVPTSMWDFAMELLQDSIGCSC